MNTENWKWFRLPEIFSRLQKCKCANATELLEEGTGIAYIGAKKNDNGVMQYVHYNANLVTKGNCIVLIGDGQGSVGYSLYQPNDFIGSTTLIAGYAERLNPYTAQFLVAIIDQDRYRYSFGRKFNLAAISNTRIKLPAITNAIGEIFPDWQWMENYIKETIIPKLPSKSKSVWQQQFDKTPLSNQKLELKTDEWKRFVVGEIFQCETTSHCIDYEMDKGSTPFVSRSATNNGVSNYVDKKDKIVYPKNCITIGAEGIIAFYQPKSFLTGVKIYTIRSPYLNPYVAMFICTILDMEVYRYNYGYARILEKIKKEKIKLPAIKNANSEYEPDWQWMEDYIKGLPYSKAL